MLAKKQFCFKSQIGVYVESCPLPVVGSPFFALHPTQLNAWKKLVESFHKFEVHNSLPILNVGCFASVIFGFVQLVIFKIQLCMNLKI